jgi:sugar/nucleoside kinase (ribokinase family)
MNEGEAACLCGKSEWTTLKNFIRELLHDFDLDGVFITLGQNGVLAGTKAEKGQFVFKQIPAMAKDIVVRDIIGCGDAFGAAFFTHFLTKRNFWQATGFANQVAARNATFMGSITKEHFETHIKPYAIIEK